MEGESEAVTITYAELDRQAGSVRKALQALDAVGERALLLYPPGQEYVVAFFGCLSAQVIAVPAYPPRSNRSLLRLQSIIENSHASIALTTSAILSRIKTMSSPFPAFPAFQHLSWLTTDTLPDMSLEEHWSAPMVREDALAFLQYTSGSTGIPKGVMVSHGNLMHNSAMIMQSFGHTAQSVGVSWLPPYHDMGLIGGIIQPLYVGFPCILLSPTAFLQRPARWLQAISHYQATTSGGPDFAYDLCVERVPLEQRLSLDLSHWEVAFNGAEPVRAETLRRFSDAFAVSGFRSRAFYPCYGLAEATLIVSGGERASSPVVMRVDEHALEQHQVVSVDEESVEGKELVGSGHPLHEQSVIVVHPESRRRCLTSEVGEVWIKSPSVALGYWQQKEETASTFQAFLATGEGPYLRTGDLGCIVNDELFITGRLKDLIIIRGRNHYPQDIEQTVALAYSSCIVGSGAAFSIDVSGEERLVVAQEIERHAAADIQTPLNEIRKRIAIEHGLSPYAIVLIRQGSIPKTSSGKIQRQACKSDFLHGRLRVIAEWREQVSQPAHSSSAREHVHVEHSMLAIEQQLCLFVSRKLHIDPSAINRGETLASYGLDSLTIIELKHEIEHTYAIDLSLVDLFEASITDLSKLIYRNYGRADLLTGKISSVAPSSSEESYALSYGQQALWFLQKLDPTSAAYNLTYAVSLHGEINVAALHLAFQTLLERYPALRTSFFSKDGTPLQRVLNSYELDWQEKDASLWTSTVIHEYLSAEAHRPFDLERGQLLRVRLLRQSSQHALLLLAVHHIAIDFWSFALLIQDLQQLSTASTSDAPWQSEHPPYLYREYIEKQQAWLRSKEGQASEGYWKEQLSGVLPVLHLPTDKPRPPVQTYVGATKTYNLDKKLAQQLRDIARENNTTLYVVLLAAFEVLLHRYTLQDDFFVGSPVAGRDWKEFARQAGYFVNTLPLRARLSPTMSFKQLVDQVRQTTLNALRHQHYPFPLMVEQTQQARDIRYAPIFQVMFVWQQAPFVEEQDLAAFALQAQGATIQLGDVSIEPFALERCTAQFDITLIMTEYDAGLSVGLEYNTDLFEAATIERLLQHWEALLSDIITHPDRQINELNLLPQWERTLLLEQRHIIGQPLTTDCVHHLFEQQATRTPEAVAVVWGDHQMNYGQLNAQANRLAHHLQASGVGPDALVGICMQRSPALVIGLLAVLKAGGAYVPLDPAYPAERLRYIIQDTRMKTLLVDQENSQKWEDASQDLTVVCWHEENVSPTDLASTNPVSAVSPQHLAYIIYTSGSTGRPKGVAIQHQSTVTLLDWSRTIVTDSDLSGIVASTSICFDLSVFELFVPLCRGGTIILVEDALHIATLTESDRPLLLNTVPSAMSALLNMGGVPASARKILLAGEALQGNLVRELYQKTGVQQIYNLYGPSEDTTYSTFAAIPPDVHKPTIGRPIAHTRVYVLDQQLQLVPIGLTGELYIAGAGLARGYHNKPALTAEVFVPNPWGQEPGERLYKTGDLVRYRQNGSLEFVGRIDQQIKLRGYRIEPGEIETVLKTHPEIGEAVALLREDQAGEPQLVVYLVWTASEKPNVEASEERLVSVRHWLKAHLPSYMQPNAYVILPGLPLTANGKLDRNALPAPKLSRELQSELEEPRNEQERCLQRIWQQVLGREEIGIQDNFFEVGGHSLLATRIVARIRQEWKLEVPLRLLFERPTIASLAEALTQTTPNKAVDRIPGRTEDRDLPLSFGQQRLWFLEQWEPGNPVYHLPAAVLLEGRVEPSALEACLNLIVERHESLRTAFVLPEGSFSPIQVIMPAIRVPLVIHDLRGWQDRAQAEQEATRLLTAAARQPFDLRELPLLRAILVQLTEQEHVFLLCLHHIIADGWSLRLFLQELAQGYPLCLQGRASSSLLPELPLQYADYALWQREWLQSELLAEQERYWQERLRGAPPVLELPTDHPRPAVQSLRGNTCSLSLSEELTSALRTWSQQQGVTLFITVLSAWYILLARWSGQQDLCVGTPVAGRTRVETEALIGFFVNTLVIRCQLAGDPRVDQVLQQVKERVLEAQAHQDVPFERVVELLEPERALSHSPLFQVMLAWQQNPLQEVELPGLRMRPFPIETGTAKFDLTLFVEDQGERIAGLLEYSSDLFEETTMKRLLEQWQNVLEEMVQRPQARISELELLSQRERSLLLEQWNATESPLPATCMHHLFEQQVERTPEAVAVRCGERQMNYEQLNAQANRLAHQLQAQGVGPEVLVSLLMHRGIELLVAILAVFKAGGAYLPLDPFYPSARMRHVLQHSQSPLMLTTREFTHTLNEVLNEEFRTHVPQILFVEECLRHEHRNENLSVVVSPRHLAYVIYTSGSTGLPKGVMIEQRGMLNHLYAKIRDVCLTSQDVVAQTAAQCFDISVWQYLAVLLVGGRVHILDDEEARDPVALLRQVQANHITVLEVVPSLLHSLLANIEQNNLLRESLYPLRWMISTGEALSPELCQQWFKYYPAIPLFNAYGPTECSDDVTHSPLYQPYHDKSSYVPIGKAIMNMRLYVLDRTLRPVVLGAIGELYIGGIGVGRGYLRDEARTAEAFVPNPWGQEPGERLYKTGDLVRYRQDGSLEFVGRADQQIKLRGYRIEPGEIEATLKAHLAVREAVVLLREDQVSEPRLVAYLVWNAQETLDAEASEERFESLRLWLKAHLPLYMQPSAYVILPNLPLTRNGKIDRKALPALDQSSRPQAEFEEPRNEQERRLLHIWQQVLGREEIGIQDNFFEVGGHSLLATQVVARIRQEWGLEVPLRLLFERPTIASLAASISQQLEQQKGQETISHILKRIELLSEDEVRNLLGQ